MNNTNNKMNIELVFIPSPGIGHLASAVELGKRMVDRHPHLTTTFFLMRHPFEPKVENIATSLLSTKQSPRLRLLNFPTQNNTLLKNSPNNIAAFLHILLHHHTPRIKSTLSQMLQSATSKLVGLVLDMFCVTFTEIADEFNLPSYMYFPCSAAFLGLLFHTDNLNNDLYMNHILLPSPVFTNPIPLRFLPCMITDEQLSVTLREMTSKYRKTRGIIVNTFAELEELPLRAMAKGETGVVPFIYPVGPVISENRMVGSGEEEIMKWLDGHPWRSVVFVCFGSMGVVSEEQAGEIAEGLEKSGRRFLWVLRREKRKDLSGLMGVGGGVPEGFLERVEGRGKVVKWAPQERVLGHVSVGGFVSHCGWNSVLEGMWFGVPMAAWPMFADQQVNGFQLTKEMGLGVEMAMEYRKELMEDANMKVSGEEIERRVGELMESGRGEKMMGLKEICRRSVMDGGSSSLSIDRFVENLEF